LLERKVPRVSWRAHDTVSVRSLWTGYDASCAGHHRLSCCAVAPIGLIMKQRGVPCLRLTPLRMPVRRMLESGQPTADAGAAIWAVADVCTLREAV